MTLVLDIIVGTRPNFIKCWSIVNNIQKNRKFKEKFNFRLIHTGQHFSEEMSKLIFKELKLPKPHYHFQNEPGTSMTQLASFSSQYERLLEVHRPDGMLVFGDVTSTLAGGLTGRMNNIPVFHVESGLRSFDNTMPEEINRKLVDNLSTLLFTSMDSADRNLSLEGFNSNIIFPVGNIMIDTLKYVLEKNNVRCTPTNQVMLTIHRPSNADSKLKLNQLVNQICQILPDRKIIFPVHPRTLKNIQPGTLLNKNLTTTKPMGYVEFIKKITRCSLVVTDSGGLSEETTYLGVPCVTLRDNTERPETVNLGTNLLANEKNLKEVINSQLKRSKRTISDHQIPRWDGKTGFRVLEHLVAFYD